MGTSTLLAKSDGQTISSNDVNQYRAAFNEDIVPRNSTGAATDDAGDIGNGTYRFSNSHADNYHIGTTANGLKIIENGSNQISIQTASVERVVIDANGLDAGGLKDLTITGAKIAETTIPGSKITTGSIDSDRLETLNKDLSVTSGAYSTTSTSFVTALTAIITTARPVMLCLVADENGTNTSSVAVAATAIVNEFDVSYQIKRGSTVLGIYQLKQEPGGGYLSGDELILPTGILNHVDFGLSGTGTYTVQVKVNSVNTTAKLNYVKLLAYEL